MPQKLLAPCYGTWGSHVAIILQCSPEPSRWNGTTTWWFGESPAIGFSWGPASPSGDPSGWTETEIGGWELIPIPLYDYFGYTGFLGNCGEFVNCRWVWDRFWYQEIINKWLIQLI